MNAASIQWERVNQNLVAKSIGELTFEQVLTPLSRNSSWELNVSTGATYTFEAKMGIWEHLVVTPNTLKRNNEKVTSAAVFFMDIQKETGMDDIILANFLEEMHNTLYSDLKIIEASDEVPATLAATLDGEQIQALLNGHPKILLNKGRIGFGERALSLYSPEAAKSFKLAWIAVAKELLQGEIPTEDMIDECFNYDDKVEFIQKMIENQVDLTTHALIPTHPWQWDHFISIQFQGHICRRDIIYIGEAGDEYRPQISIRTLSNISRPEKADIKLPLTILNTSCIRGLPAKSIALGTKVSTILDKICKEDPLLQKSGTIILKEKAGVAMVHPAYAEIKGAPYRYHEYLGAIWREAARSKTDADEMSVITATLFYQDKDKQSLIGEYIKRSGLTTKTWLEKYFDTIVIPLYHLQLNYGVGMVAHGQNIILKLKDYVPVGMILKDFQGDLRLSTQMPHEGAIRFKEVESEMTKLPPHYLIHDLITGHFITVLRFISEVMEESNQLPETEFYSILAERIGLYIKDKKINEDQSLLRNTFERVLLNKVRFAIGYADSSERPLPQVGRALVNPLSKQTK